MKLEGQVALITGGSRGLGLAIGRALAREGVAIACLARPGAELDRAAAGLAALGPALAVPADVTSGDQVEAAVRVAVAKWNRLDIVVLNAGTWQGGPLHETPESTWDLLLDLNLKGAFLTLKHALPHLVAGGRGGTVVGIGSIGAWAGQAGSAAYSASKWGLRGLLESAALEYKPHGVRVSLVHPHRINSEGRPIAPGSAERREHLEPDEIASLVAWICAAPAHVSVGNVTIWPIAAGVSFT